MKKIRWEWLPSRTWDWGKCRKWENVCVAGEGLHIKCWLSVKIEKFLVPFYLCKFPSVFPQFHSVVLPLVNWKRKPVRTCIERNELYLQLNTNTFTRTTECWGFQSNQPMRPHIWLPVLADYDNVIMSTEAQHSSVVLLCRLDFSCIKAEERSNVI